MKISIFFRDEPKATAESKEDESITLEGSGIKEVNNLIEYYTQKTQLNGSNLLAFLLTKLQGYWWAEEINNTATNGQEEPNN